MKRIVITTESGTDLPAERAQALDIRIIPMWVVTEREGAARMAHFRQEKFSLTIKRQKRFLPLQQ